MIFLDRAEAGRELLKRLTAYAKREDVLVLAIPRGGLAVAREVALGLRAPMDIFTVRKLGVPGREELAFGAIASGGHRFLDSEILEVVGISDLEIERITTREKLELERRESLYRSGRPPLALEGRTIILIDDGIATGSSMQVAIAALRHRAPFQIVVAVPVAPASTCRRLRREVDDLVCVQVPDSFYAVGEFYQDFSEVSDEAVTALLRDAPRELARSVANTG